jgi:glycine/D-amino acid oxidase-like deaminating enzyme
VVEHGADVADDHIAEIVQPGELVITADIPLADRIIRKGGVVLDPRGDFLDSDNIGPRLALRDLMDGLRAEGVHIPQLSVLATVARTEPLAQAFEGCLADDRVGIRRRADGGYTIAPGGRHDYFVGPDAFRNMGPYLPVLKRDYRSTRFRARSPSGYPDAWGTPRHWGPDEVSPFERMRILNPAPNLGFLGGVQDVFGQSFPDLGRPAIRTAWAGMIDMIPDIVPVIDRVAAVPGLVIATGMCGHGFGIGPGVGRVVADLVAGKDIGHDLTRFRLSRFSDGSALVPGPTL